MNHKEILKKMQNFKFDYDKENDDLFLYNPKSKSKGSVELGQIILDFNSDKELVGIEILNASELITDIVDGKDSCEIKKLLLNLKECKMDIKVKENILMVKMILIGSFTVSPMLTVPTIKERSPALRFE